MSDTAQPTPAAETVDTQLDNASDAFKSFLNPEPVKLRDEAGRFAPQTVEQDEDEEIEDDAEAEAPVESEDDDELAEDAEAADEAQPEAVPMPSSWSKEHQEQWDALPSETQVILADREEQRERVLNTKLQEAANIRKANEALVQEAATNRDKYAQEIDGILELYSAPEPNPDNYVIDGEYHRDAYDRDHYQWRKTQEGLNYYRTQREEISAQQAREAEQFTASQIAEVEQVAWPKFLAEVPDLGDPAKGKQIIDEVIRYSIGEGIPERVFSDPESLKTLTSAELRLAWKAMQYDRQQEAAKRVQAKKPAPKPAAPPVKPGGVATRQSVEKSRFNKASERLAREGSVEAGAAVFKHLFR